MLDEFTRERLDGWVADFVHGEAFGSRPAEVTEHAQAVLRGWLEDACLRADADPAELELGELREALLQTVARYELPDAVHTAVPRLARDLLVYLEQEGRLANGRDLGLSLATAADAYERARSGAVESLTRPSAKIGRNDPCPCGSGKKYKRCCARA